MTQRIFRSIVFTVLAVLLAASALIMGVLYSYFNQTQRNQLRIETALASHAVANEGMDYFDKLDGTMDCRITWIGRDGTVLYDNRSDSESMVNHLAREEVIQALQSEFGQSSRYSVIAHLAEAALSGKKAEQTVLLGVCTCMAAARPVKTEGVLSGVVILLLDLTQKQKAEALRREFTANVSHELKTPLHAISGYAELLKSGLVQPRDTLVFSEKIYTEAQRLISLVEDILRLSRLDEGAADMHWVTTDLYEALCRTAGELEGPAGLSGVTLEISGEPALLSGIPQLHNAILFNLLDNAIKYNRRGGRVTATVVNEGDCVVLTVSDTGIGIPQQHQERIFERFYRVDKSHSKEVSGTGLGLSIVKHAVQILHGELQLSSITETGTRIQIRFPKKAEQAAH